MVVSLLVRMSTTKSITSQTKAEEKTSRQLSGRFMSVQNDLSGSMLSTILQRNAVSVVDNRYAHYCNWYPEWIREQVANMPSEVVHSIPDIRIAYDEIAKNAKVDHSLDRIAHNLLQRRMIVPENELDATGLALTIVFMILGWQSMLYQADISKPSGPLAITDVLDGYRSHSFFRLCPDELDVKRPVASTLLEFGLMLPKVDFCTCEEAEDREAWEKAQIVTPASLNAAALSDLANFKFKWVDTIAPHLELDKATNTIFLYRWPSFCLAHTCCSGDHALDSVLHRYVE
jgi:hypothetical protein